MAKVTIIEVAAAAKVSKTTASDILRGAGSGYNADTIEIVRKAADALGYQANAAARLLRQGSTNLVGIAVGARQRPHINNLVVAAHDECLKRGFQPVIFEPSHLLPDQNRSPFPSPELLAGVLSADFSVGSSLPGYYRAISQQLPIVALYPTAAPDIDFVSADWIRAIQLGVEHLVGLGHGRIAYAHDPNSPYSIDRLRASGWRQCIEKYNLDETAASATHYRVPEPLATVGEKMINISQPIVEFTDQVIEGLLNASVKPTALLCTSDELALSVIGRLTRLGWKLPDDLSIIGFYGTEYGEYAFPRLTTIVHPASAIAAASVERLHRRIQAKAAGEELTTSTQQLEPVLLVRDSTVRAVKS